MVKQIDLVKPESPEVWGNHGNTEDEFEEYSEEEFFSEEESNENLSMSPKKEGSCAILSKVEGSCAEKPKEDKVADKESAEEVSCGDESDHENSCPEEPNEEDPDEESETASAEYLTLRTTLEEASDEDPSNVSFEEIIEEEFYEESEEESIEEEPLRDSMDQQLPLVTDSDGVPKASDHIFLESKASAESNNLSTDAIVSKQPDDPLTSRKKRRSRWDIKAEAPMLVNVSGDQDKRKSRWSSDTKTEAPILVNNNADLKRRKTRWSNDETQLNMPCTLKLPDSVKDILSDSYNDQRIQKLNAKLQEINQKLDGSMMLNEEPQEESSPSPQSIDVSLDSSVDGRKLGIRLKLLKQKLNIISELTKNKKKGEPKCRSNHCYTFSKKLYIPQKEFPSYNFVGLILGPHGNTMKKMEKETGAVILLRGRGSKFKNKLGTYAGEDDLHVLIQADSQICLDSAVSMVEKLLVPVDDIHNYHKSAQLRELARLRGTLNEGRLWMMKQCDICGMSSHPTSDCPLTATASKASANFLAGTGSLFSSFNSSSLSPSHLPFVAKAYDHIPKECDPANLFVCYLPQSVCTDKLKELFLPYGSICDVKVIMDKSTSQNKGYGFVKYTSASDAAKAIENMNGYSIDGKKLAVRIAGTSPPLNANLPIYPGSVSIPTPPLIASLPKFPVPPQSSNVNLPNYLGLLHPSTSNANLPNYPGLASTPHPSNANLPSYSKLAAIAQEIPKPNCWPGPPGSMLPESSISFPKSSYNLSTYTETVPSHSSASLDSTFQTTSLGKNEYIMDGNQLNVTVAGTRLPSLSAKLSNYPGFAVTREIPEPNCWPCPPGSMLPESSISFPKSSYNLSTYTETVPSHSSASLDSTFQTTSLGKNEYIMDGNQLNVTVAGTGLPSLSAKLSNYPGFAVTREIPEPSCWPCPSGSIPPESGTYFPKSKYSSLNYTESVAYRSSTYLGSSSQTSISSSQFPGVSATSNELASFPGYLKSFDPPGELDQSVRSSSLSSRAPYFIGNFSGNQMNPTWP